jgi:uncharacterized protein
VLCSSPETAAEFEGVCERPSVRAKLSTITPEAVAAVCELLRNGCYARAVRRVAVCRDPNDDRFVACALATGAGYVVTYDNDLLALDGYEGLMILTPEDFLHVLSREALDDEGNSQL